MLNLSLQTTTNGKMNGFYFKQFFIMLQQLNKRET